MTRFVTPFTLLFLTCSLPSATAGGGPENVAVIVNDDSEASQKIAQEYVRLRNIPACNVIRLKGISNVEQIKVDEFRDKILKLVLETIETRGLKPQIDCIAYSADFPWAIDARGDFKGKKLPRVLSPICSINGLTYLHERVLNEKREYLPLNSNRYTRLPARTTENDMFDVQPSIAFHAETQWSVGGKVVEKGGERYLLSTMLAVTSGRGNSVDESIAALRRSAGADGTKPEGTFYFMVNKNVRSTTREPFIPSAVAALTKLGMKAEINEGKIPSEKTDVVGAVIGTASFDWPASKSKMLPGAICEHLTSFGGVMRSGAGQTPCTEFIKHGAAGSSGTVTEPYAIQAKFPLAFLHVHYAGGCSLAEAFYQSVQGPCQLLVVGDPLCQPWASPPDFRVQGVKNKQPITGKIEITPQPKDADSIKHFELFVDGVRQTTCLPGETLSLMTEELSNGGHELRVVAIGATAIETQSRKIYSVEVKNEPPASSASE